MKYYAGIGARLTPEDTLMQMHDIAIELASDGYTLRSGRAVGADQMFEEAARKVGGQVETFEAKDCITAAEALAGNFHPNWGACRPYVRQLHGRNAMILLGKDLHTPVDFVVCWTPAGVITGGTGMAIRIADEMEIPVVNLAVQEWVLPSIQTTLHLA